MRKRILAVGFLLSALQFSWAVEWNVPENYSFVIEEDCKSYNDQIKDAYGWLMNTPIGEDDEKTKETMTFVTKWCVMSSDVSVIISDKFALGGDPYLIIMYMAAWSVYQLESGEKEDTVSAAVFTIEKLLQYYDKNKSYFSQYSDVKKRANNFTKLQKKGKLREFVAENMNEKKK